MKAIAIVPGRPETAGVIDMPDPRDSDAMTTALVLGNKVAFGTVSAARRHYDQAAEALARANPKWLTQLITRRLLY